MARMPFIKNFADEDPLTRAMAPPPDESQEERNTRLRREADAQRISDEIDERIGQDRAAWRRNKSLFKLLLLGQSESGKSTTLKNFQLAFARRAWQAERASWRAVIQLNLIRSVNTVLDVFTDELARADAAARSPSSSPPFRPTSVADRPALFALAQPLVPTDSAGSDHNHSSTLPRPRTQPVRRAHSAHVVPAASQSKQSPPPPLPFASKHSLLKLRLAPLRRVEADLTRRLGAASVDEQFDAPEAATPSEIGSASAGDSDDLMVATPFDVAYARARRAPGEPFVRAHRSWRDSLGEHSRGRLGRRRGESSDREMDTDDATEVIASCAEAIAELWADEVVQEMLRRRKMRLDHGPGFFLNDVGRIATRGYEPSDDDVVRARLRTLGVQEHHLVFETETGSDIAKEWIIYDVGGSRTTRAAWLPYFDDANAILFLAPISCFDELLTEDHRVNRLEDSFVLWKAIVSSKLLANCILILFLNKFDLLERKLQSGVQVRKYLPSFGERENAAPVLAKYLHHKFREQMKELSPKPRQFYGYLTSAINTRATAATLSSVRDGIIRQHLEKADFV
ncbi:heterotrimeric G-protein alpha subunit [Gelatoporia subvermispora B]|uniref:Heterotrimeric G-protein alpha subunit n=1 Tax=Ceriporiopsis subvermispora (strain B) TaxID=914234 RepID=M2R787_CERS8|nr:heterotrimeric G-protein alpha subunit [Gelatoporia subvermispora B]